MNKEQSFQENNNAEEQIPVQETEAVEAVANNEQTEAGGETAEPTMEQVVSKDELDRAQAHAEEQTQRLLRAQADFDNFRRRTQKEKEDLAKYASAQLITELIPVIDNFERAMATKPEHPELESFSKGVDMIFRQLSDVLKNAGLTTMETVGQPFNPEFHQAVMQVESEEYEEGIIVEELQKGYVLKDKVLRPAMVKVSG
ncbi:nucleotide exchange factor GrpE [Paenibacillus hunanensis]|uniref:nucleotide exchange factor GrpE n=1 Tax=Paenibacillus hunanensis TaxID=539262 RepID=UPI00202615E2|nr:nucleotide exchange factor GrpE [Paenibacillus hunanensis]MCL9660580.1 nucleotide exchange factor GrpE [Paenibacillus hunanensis]